MHVPCMQKVGNLGVYHHLIWIWCVWPTDYCIMQGGHAIMSGPEALLDQSCWWPLARAEWASERQGQPDRDVWCSTCRALRTRASSRGPGPPGRPAHDGGPPLFLSCRESGVGGRDDVRNSVAYGWNGTAPPPSVRRARGRIHLFLIEPTFTSGNACVLFFIQSPSRSLFFSSNDHYFNLDA
jgi:hypothetical protein